MTYNRLELIKNYLDEKKVVSFKELSEAFPDVSLMTIRRDIEKLEYMGMAMRIRGGAKKIETETERETAYFKRMKQNPEVKATLAAKALEFIDTGRSIFIDSGSTMMELAKILSNIPLSIITSGPNIALEVMKQNEITVNLTGGTLNSNNCSLAGACALASLKLLNIDYAFISPSGYSKNGGFTVGNYADSEVKRAVIKKASTVIMLMSKDKIDKSLPFTFASLKDIDIIITDIDKQSSILKGANKFNVKIINV